MLKIKGIEFKSIFINLTILLFLFRTSIPFLKFPFIICYLMLIVYSFIENRGKILFAIKDFFCQYYLLLVLTLILIISFFASDKIYLIVFKDLISSLIILSLLFIMTLHIDSIKQLNNYVIVLFKWLIVFSLLISFFIIADKFNLLEINQISPEHKSDFKSFLLTFSSDYNFASVMVYLGIFSTFFFLLKEESLAKIVAYNLILTLYYSSILLSGSRRAFFILIILIALILFIQFYSLFDRNKDIRRFVFKSLLFPILVGALATFFWYFSFHASNTFKNKVLVFLGSKDLRLTKIELSMAVSKYVSIFNKGLNSYDQYDVMWSAGSEKALDPDSGWGTSIHTTVFPLKGDNVAIVPKGSCGYLLDSKCNVSVWDGSAHSLTLIGNSDVKKGDIVDASVYCFVSEDFNGGQVQIYAQGETYGKTYAYYYIPDSGAEGRIDEILNNRTQNNDTLSKFKSFGPKEQSEFGNSLSFKKIESGKHINLFSNGDFKNGTKFWFPSADSTKHEIVESPFGKSIRISRSNGNDGSWSLRYCGRPIIYYAGHEYQLKFNFKVIQGTEIPFNIGWWIYDGDNEYSAYALPVTIKDLSNGWKEAQCSYRFKKTSFNVPTLLNSLKDYSIVDISNVELTDLDIVENTPLYVDQLDEIILKNKGAWQKLRIRAECNDGKAPVYIGFSKYGVQDFYSLKGYVIFAYPQYQIIGKNNTSSYLIDDNHGSTVSTNISKRNRSVHYQKDAMRSDVLKAGLFNPNFLQSNVVVFQPIDHDPIREWASKFISEDTTYYGYKADIKMNIERNSFTATRLSRWLFAMQIFKKEYTLVQKIFGGGFNFLNWYGKYFYKDKTRSDYPHNPFLSILLYSGFLGLLVYIYFLYKVIFYYLKYYRDNKILFFFFLITFFFSFFSGGSPLDPPIMGFFIMLPFFIHHISKKERI